MSEETGSPFDQVEELWKQWYASSSKTWTDILTGTKEGYVDPYGLYNSWLKTLEESQRAGTTGFADAQEIWKKWSEATLSTDPLTSFKQWYESSTWSKAIGELIGTEKFVEETSRYLESYTSFYKAFRRLNEDYFSKLQITTRADLAHVAEIIIELENKVDWVQDAFEDFQGKFPQFATLESIRLLGNQLESLENKLQKLPEAFERSDTRQNLSQRLDGIEGKLSEILPALQKIDTLQDLDQRLRRIEERIGELPATLKKINAIGSLEKRLDGVENRLDKLLGLLEKMGTQQPVTTAPVRTPQRRTTRAKAHQETLETESESTSS